MMETLVAIKGFVDNWENLIAAGGVLIAVIVAAWTVFNDKTNIKLNGLNLVFQKFNNNEARTSRQKVLSSYGNFLIVNKKNLEYKHDMFATGLLPEIDISELYPEIRQDVERVKADLEEIAVMEKNGLVDQMAYFDAYYGSMLRCYMAIYGNIQKARKISGSKHYTTYLEKQSVKAIKYWKKNHPTSTIRFYIQERNDFLLQRYTGEGMWFIRILHPKTPIIKCVVECDGKPLTSFKNDDQLEHTIEEGGGDNFSIDPQPNNNSMITVKSDGKIIKYVQFTTLEEG